MVMETLSAATGYVPEHLSSRTIGFALSALAMWCWPTGNRRLPPAVSAGGGTFHPGHARSAGASKMSPIVQATLISAGIAVLVSIAAGVAGGAVYATVTSLIRKGRRRTEIDRTRTEIIDALQVLGRELQAGSSVPSACDAAAGTSGSGAAPLISALGIAARLGSDSLAPSAPVSFVDRTDPAGGMGRSLAAAWTLSRTHGIPLAALVQGAAEDLSRTAAAAARQNALLAGPRLSGYLLSALPVLGILLGLGMGANPVPVLFGDGIGAILLIAGALLTCGGLLWSARIAR